MSSRGRRVRRTPSAYREAPSRGRPHSEKRLYEYIIGISRKHGVVPSDLYNSILEAWKNGKSSCDCLGVECRSLAEDGGVFLVTLGQDPVGQFHVPSQFLSGGDPFQDLGLEDVVTLHGKRGLIDGRIKVRELRMGMREASVRARVVEISETKGVFTRFGEYASVATATIEDDTGTVKLTLWNGQIGSISEGDVVEVENARVAVYNGEIQLSVGKRGRLSLVEDPNLL